jgi:alpha-tubulin suppressor-like RCC1 family protein
MKILAQLTIHLFLFGQLFSVFCGSALSAIVGNSVVAWGGLPGYESVTNVPANLTNVIAISAGNAFSLALRSDGTVVAWGLSENGATNVPGDLTNAVAVASGHAHSLALTSDRRVVAWGFNFAGQTEVPAGITNAVGIGAGFGHSVILTEDGRVIAWGRNREGQTNVPPGLSNVVAVSAGGFGNLALKSDGAVVAWGFSTNGFPADLSNVVVAAVGGTWNYITGSIILTADGRMVGWSNDQEGFQNIENTSTLVALARGGAYDSLALAADGTVIPFGPNWWGQSNAPPGLRNVIGIAMGYAHSLALVGDVSSLAAGRMGISRNAAGGVSWQFPNDFGKTYVLERKDSLIDSSWNFVRLFRGNGGVQECEEANPFYAARFYRIRRMP